VDIRLFVFNRDGYLHALSEVMAHKALIFIFGVLTACSLSKCSTGNYPQSGYDVAYGAPVYAGWGVGYPIYSEPFFFPYAYPYYWPPALTLPPASTAPPAGAAGLAARPVSPHPAPRIGSAPSAAPPVTGRPAVGPQIAAIPRR
jgi:hypothetical protein